MDQNEIPKIKTTIFNGWLYFLPVFTLLYVIFSGFTPSRAALFGILATIIVSWFFKEKQILIRQFIEVIQNVLYAIAPLVVATAAAGILIGAINLTGLAGKFTSLIFTVAGDSLLIVLIISAIISILLGMGMPTPGVYILTATLVAPAIIEAGVPTLPAHLFLIFFAAMSAITPPVGVAAYTAAGIAEASPLKIGATAVKLAIAAFLLPFMFVFQPALILQADSIVTTVFAIVFACIGLFTVAIGCEGYWVKPISTWKRGALIISGIAVIYPNILSLAIGLIVISVILFSEYRQRRNNTLLEDEKIV
jgi:TRAP transporter 4TM/12TM fusion protein